MSNINLIPNPSFALGLDGWSAEGSISLSISNSFFYTGNESLRAVNSNTSLVTPAICTSAIDRIPVKASTTYVVSAYVLELSAPANVYFSVDLYDSYGNVTAAITSGGRDHGITTTTGADWERPWLTFDTLSDTVSVVVKLKYSYIGDEDDFYVDSMRLEEGSTPSDIIEVRTQDQKNKLTARALQPEFINHLKGMQLRADIILNGMVFNTIDEYGVVWIITNVTGWNQLPEIEVQDFPRGFGDGSYLGLGRYAARVINIEGVFLTQDAVTQLPAARDRLFQALNMVKKDGLLIMKESPVKASRVRLSGTPEIETENARGRTRFSFGLTAGDPIKYECDITNPNSYSTANIASNDEININNIGNTPVSAVFTINGPTTGSFSILNKTNSQLLTSPYKIRDTKEVSVTSTLIDSDSLKITPSAYTGSVAGDVVELTNVPDIYEMSTSLVRYNDGTYTVGTKVNHNLAIGQKVIFNDVTNSSGDGVIISDGTVGTITAIYNPKSFRVSTGHGASSASITLNDTAKCAIYSELSTVSYSFDESSATVTTSNLHGLLVGQKVVINGAGIPYDGTHVVTEIVTGYKFKIKFTTSQIWSTITQYSCSSSLATIKFSSNPKIIVGDRVTVFGVATGIDGTHTVSGISGSGPYYVSFVVENVSDIGSTNIAVSGRARAYISRISDRTQESATGNVYYGEIMNGTYEVQSTSSTSASFYVTKNLSYNLTSTTYSSWVSFSPTVRWPNESLSIDTYTKEISINGSSNGNRSKIDTLIDWVQLEPGSNIIQFKDANPIYVSSKKIASNYGYLTTFVDHGYVVGTSFTVVGVDSTFNGVYTVYDIVSPREIKFVLTAGNVSLTALTSGYIQESSTSSVDIQYRSGWIN